ncbi:TonB-dependent receptor [Aquirhabdus sp.]|uniref:TonB-dependent receptor n=1 Tax=Aquirhabdus sp. TaxID=2824160 RepID=UPI00396C6C6B
MSLRAIHKQGVTFTYRKASTVASMLAITLPSMAMATESQESVLPTIKVEATKDKPAYQVKKVQSPKYTEPLRDTPQTITVVDKKAIEDQSMLSLREILSTVPGITFGAGEGGSGYGDKINIRGFNASNDITVDGIRESAQFTRTDPFNLEQVEVVKGSNSTNSGSGAVGGSINLVSKTPENKNFVDLGASLGTDHYYRTTVDANQKIDDTTAVRLNLMAHKNDVPGRDVEEMKRWGIAPSITFGMGTPTRFTLSYIYQTDDNTPQYGVPFYNGRAVPGIDPSNYYGYANVDEQKTSVNEITALFEHEFNDNMSVRNITRAAKVEQYSLVDAPEQLTVGAGLLTANGQPNPSTGSFCLGNGTSPTGWSQYATKTGQIITDVSGYRACTAGVLPGTYAPSGPRGLVRDTENKLLTNQTDVTWKFNTAGIEHTLVTGLSFTDETYDLSTGNVFRKAGGATPNPVLPVINVYAPNSTYTGPLNYVQTSTISGTLDNQAIYAFDTLKFSDQWLFNAGLRYDHSEGKSTTLNYATPASGGAITATPTLSNNSNTWSYKAGLVYKPVEDASFYVSYGNSKTPSDATVSGAACAVTVASATAVASSTCSVKPETAVTYEVGTKWDILNGKLSLTAALFDTERSNYKVADPGNPNNPSGAQTLDGSARVRGLELGAAGLITHNWSVFANLTAQRSKVLQGASDFVAGGGINGTQGDFTKGDSLLYVPELAASLWTTYDVTRQLQLGYGVTYEGPTYLTQHGGILVAGTGTGVIPAVYAGRTTIPLAESEGYFVHNLAVTYKFTRNFSAQLNVKNIFDKEYYTSIRSNSTTTSGWAIPGDARSAVLNLTYHF